VLTNRDEHKHDALIRLPAAALVTAEALRGPQTAEAPPLARTEERMPLFWRVFGGTTLSILALVGITVYQQFNNGILDLRRELIAEREFRGDAVKKEELNSRLSPVWSSLKDANAAAGEITALKERCTMLQDQLKTAENDRKALSAELQQLRDRLVRLEARAEKKD
jgi:hypothetical protein